MKKIRIFCFVTALCLILAACGSPAAPEATTEPTIPVEEKISGSWKTAIDCTDICTNLLLEQMGQELAAYFDLNGVCVNGLLTIQPDGTFTMTIDEAAVLDFSEQVKTAMGNGLHGYLEKTLAEELAGFTLDAYLAATGLSMEDLMVMAGLNLDALVLQMITPMREVPCSGTYRVKDGKMYIAETVCAFTYTQESLQFSSPETEEDIAAFPALFPLTFERIS